MAIVDTFGKCKCGEFNALSAVTCHGCGLRLPWANVPSGGLASSAAKSSGAARTHNAQAHYWGAALGSQVGAQAGASSYNNDPDIDFAPLAGARADTKSAMGISFFCSYCGIGLSDRQHICHRCQHLTTFTKADLRFTVMISSLLVSGFLLGVVWTAVVLNAANTGEWHLPNVHYTKTQKAPSKKTAAKPAPTYASPVDEYGIAKR